MEFSVVRHASRGFTLVELMVTIAVAVVTLSIAVPAFATFVARNRVASIKSSFVASMAAARSEAARAGVPVILQAAGGGVVGNEFAGGWDLYADVDGSGTVTNGDAQLRHYEALPGGISLHGASLLVFSANGYLKPAANISYTLCGSGSGSGGYGYSVVVAPNGTAYATSIAGCTP